jgi:autotransporter-associated beta strand protein
VLTGGNAAGGTFFSYGGWNAGGSILGLDKGSNNSLTYEFFGGLSGGGTLVLVPSTPGSLGNTERCTFGTAPTVTNGMLDPSIVTQVSKTDSTGHFVSYGLASFTGFCSAESQYTTWPGGVYAPNPAEISDITGSSNMPATKTTYALRVGGAGQLTLSGGNLTINSGGLIDNGQWINGPGGLIFKNNAGAAIQAYIYAGGTDPGVINCPILAGTNLIKFGPGILMLKQANSYTGQTTINQGTLRLGNGAALPAGKAVNILGSSSVLDLNGWTTVNLGAVTLDGFARIYDESLDLGFPGGTLRAASYDFKAGTVGSTTSGEAGLNITIADQGGGPASVVTIDSSNTSSYSPTGVVLRGHNTYSGGTVINSGGILNVAYNDNLGAAAGTVTIHGGGTFQLGSNYDFTSTRTLILTGADSTIDTNGFDVTFASPIGRVGFAGGLLKTGSGTLKLTAANIYTADTTITGGVLDIRKNNNLGTGGAATEIIFSQDLTNRHSGDIPVLRFGSGWDGFDPSTTRQICLDNDGAIDTGNFNVTLAGVIADDGWGTYCGRLIKQGIGILTLSGANRFGGGLWVQQGSVKVNNAQALGTTRTINGVTYYPQVTVDGGAALELNGNSLTLGGLRGSGTIQDSLAVIGTTTLINTVPGTANIWFFSGSI